MAKYGKKSQEKVKTAVRKYKKKKLKSGKSNKTVKSRKQAVAIGLSQARAEGIKVPVAPKRKKKAVKKKPTARKTFVKKKISRKKSTSVE